MRLSGKTDPRSAYIYWSILSLFLLKGYLRRIRETGTDRYIRTDKETVIDYTNMKWMAMKKRVTAILPRGNNWTTFIPVNGCQAAESGSGRRNNYNATSQMARSCVLRVVDIRHSRAKYMVWILTTSYSGHGGLSNYSSFEKWCYNYRVSKHSKRERESGWPPGQHRPWENFLISPSWARIQVME
jgi:hypothetical protein